MPTIMISAPRYIGWRTTPYKPGRYQLLVDLDGDVRGGVAVLDDDVLDHSSPTATTTLPRTMTAVGTSDQPNRWSSALRTNITATARIVPEMMIPAPAGFLRSARRAYAAQGSRVLHGQIMIGASVATMNTAMKTHACQ